MSSSIGRLSPQLAGIRCFACETPHDPRELLSVCRACGLPLLVLAYDVKRNGAVGNRRNFAKLAGVQKTADGVNSGADGLAVDSKGRLFVASAAGIQVFSPKGEPLGVIPLPKSPQNLAFAGPGKKTLYVVGRGAAYRIVTQTEGYSGRAK